MNLTSSNPHLPVAGHRQPHGNVRRRGRERYQARIYVGGRKGGAVHLGMYESETAAEQVAKRVLRTLLASGSGTASLTPLDVWRAAQKLANNGFDIGGQLASLLPRWVCVDGRGGYGVRVKGGNGCDRGGFESVESAYAEACRLRKEMREKRVRRSSVLVQLSLLRLLGENVEEVPDYETGENRRTGPYCMSAKCVSGKVRRTPRGVNPAQLLFQFEDVIEESSAGETPDVTRSHTASIAGRTGIGREIAA